MEKLRLQSRIVDISEPLLAEDSTFSAISLSLRAVLEQLDEGATHHDYLVALLLVFLAESGFNILPASDTPKWEQNKRLVHIPTNWKSQETGAYQINLTMRDIDFVRSKLIAITYGDKLIVNILSYTGDTKHVNSMIVQTFKYVNPFTTNLCFRYMNLKEISHRFKDKLVTPSRSDTLLDLNLMGPTLESLPIELRKKIADMLPLQTLRCLSICSKKLYESIR